MLNFRRRKPEDTQKPPPLMVTPDAVTQSLNGQEVAELQQGRPVHPVETALATHVGTRDYQQDAVFAQTLETAPLITIGLLCDGMGGMSDGEKASGFAIQYFAQHLPKNPPQNWAKGGQEIPQQLTTIAQGANEMMHQIFVSQGKQSGTTLVCAYLLGNALYWVAVGDSCLYILRRGEMVRLNRDHNYGQQLKEWVSSGKFSQEEADRDPTYREALVSYLGAPTLEMMDLSHNPLFLQEGDLVLLCSDGLTSTLNEDEILQIVGDSTETLQQLAQTLVHDSVNCGSMTHDNTSVVLIQYNFEKETGT